MFLFLIYECIYSVKWKEIIFRVKADLSKNDENITIFVDFFLYIRWPGRNRYNPATMNMPGRLMCS